MSRAEFMRRAGNVKRFHTHAIIGDNTIAHHSWGVVMLCLEVVERPGLDLMRACLYHDAFEVETGDIPYTAKQRNPDLKMVSANMEADVALEMDVMWNIMPWEEHVLKFCDMLDLCWFCVSQRKLGSINMDEVMGNGRRFLTAHITEFMGYSELKPLHAKATEMFTEVQEAYYAI